MGERLLRRLCVDILVQMEMGSSHIAGDREVWWEVGSDEKGEEVENC